MKRRGFLGALGAAIVAPVLPVRAMAKSLPIANVSNLQVGSLSSISANLGSVDIAGAITADKIAAGAIRAEKILAGTITSDHVWATPAECMITDGAIVADRIPDCTVNRLASASEG